MIYRTAYISAPMSGIDPDAMKSSFRIGENLAIANQFVPVLPPNIPPYDHGTALCPPGRKGPKASHSDACYLRTDLQAMLECDAVIFMPGWTSSYGCRIEFNTAASSGLDCLIPRDGKLWLL